MQRQWRAAVVDIEGARRLVEPECFRTAQNAGLEVELGCQVDTGPSDVSAEQLLRKRRAVIRGVSFVADDGQGAVVACLSQSLSGAHTGDSGSDDNDFAKVGGHRVSPPR